MAFSVRQSQRLRGFMSLHRGCTPPALCAPPSAWGKRVQKDASESHGRHGHSVLVLVTKYNFAPERFIIAALSFSPTHISDYSLPQQNIFTYLNHIIHTNRTMSTLTCNGQ